MTMTACGAPSHTFLQTQLNEHATTVMAMVEADVPQDLLSLIETYTVLGNTTAVSEACLVAAFNALDPNVGAGRSDEPLAYHAVKQRSFQLLSASGKQFARLSDAFSQLVHGGGGWSNQ